MILYNWFMKSGSLPIIFFHLSVFSFVRNSETFRNFSIWWVLSLCVLRLLMYEVLNPQTSQVNGWSLMWMDCLWFWSFDSTENRLSHWSQGMALSLLWTNRVWLCRDFFTTHLIYLSVGDFPHQQTLHCKITVIANFKLNYSEFMDAAK